jgi:hypothetical protein
LKTLNVLIGFMCLALPVGLPAHHAATAFDRGKSIIVAGSVKKFMWTNPHSWPYMQVPDGEGGEFLSVTFAAGKVLTFRII